MSLRFVHESQPQRVCFGSGEAAPAVAREVERLGASKVMVIAAGDESELAGRVTAGLPVALRYDEVVMHVPAGVAGRAREAAKDHGVDALVSVGGGSTTGLASRGVRLGGIGAAPQDLSRPRRRLQPAARPDARGGAAVRAGVQRAGGAGGAGAGAADRRGARRRAGDRRPAGAAPRAVRAARAARLWLRGVRHPGRGGGDRAGRAAGQPRPVTAGDLRRLLRAAWAGADPVMTEEASR